MAPEIIDGEQVNEQSDVFSLGTVLYYLSTGTFPFRGDNPSHLLREIVEGNFDEPSTVEPTMSCRLNEVIVECLQRDPVDRPTSVSRLRQRLLEGIETLEFDDPEDEELRKYFKDPEGYTSEFEEAVVPKLVALGDRCADHDQTADAFHYYNRVLAYDPSNEKVTEALDDLHARDDSPYRTAAGFGVGLGLLAGIAAILFFSGSTPSIEVTDATSQGQSDIQSAVQRASAATAAHARANGAVLDSRQLIAKLLARRQGFSTLNRARDLQVTTDPPRPNTQVASAAVSPPQETAETLPRGGRPPAEQQAMPSGGEVSDAQPGERASADAGPQTPSYTYSFRVLPLAATVYIDGDRYSVPTVHRGVDLKPGRHRIRVESRGCRTYTSTFYVDGPADETRRIVLEWRDAFVQVESDVPAVVYVDGNRSSPVRIGANGEDARVRIPFGKADATGSQTRRQVALEVRARDNMQSVRRQTVTVRPGASASLTVNFRN
jgi:serine/threonine-protein kinase